MKKSLLCVITLGLCTTFNACGSDDNPSDDNTSEEITKNDLGKPCDPDTFLGACDTEQNAIFCGKNEDDNGYVIKSTSCTNGNGYTCHVNNETKQAGCVARCYGTKETYECKKSDHILNLFDLSTYSCQEAEDGQTYFFYDKGKSKKKCGSSCNEDTGECKDRVRDEHQPCNPGTFIDKCEGNALVYCGHVNDDSIEEPVDIVTTRECGVIMNTRYSCKTSSTGITDCVRSCSHNKPYFCLGYGRVDNPDPNYYEPEYYKMYSVTCETMDDGEKYEFEKFEKYCKTCDETTGECEEIEIDEK